MQTTMFRRDELLRSVPVIAVPRVSFEEFVALFVDLTARPGVLVIREDLPHIDVMRAGIRIGLTFTFEDFDDGPRMIAARAAQA
jgi:hypothetical protein